MTTENPNLRLSNGRLMPALGLGTWQSSPAEAKAAVKFAIKTGYRLIDTASVYQNEEAIGDAIKEAIEEGLVTREQLFITTKAWTNEIAPGKLEEALRSSLKKLQLDYVDLYLAHVPTAFNEDMSAQIHSPVEEIWRQFDEVYRAGLSRSVGVSNWSNSQIARALSLRLVPVHNSQVEAHLYFPQHEHVIFCMLNRIVVTSYATLGSPGRVNFTLPSGKKLEWAPARSELEDNNVIAVAEACKRTPAQILLRYALERGMGVIPKSTNEKRILENFQSLDFQLEPRQYVKLEDNYVRQRLFLQDFMEGHPEDSFAKERK